MKILFLDVDGVLNSAKSSAHNNEVFALDPYMCLLVARICEQTGAEIVLSSSWRLSDESSEVIKQRVFPVFIDKTPDLHGSTDRGCEIQAWMDVHPEVTRYAILDDNPDFHPDQPLFKTDWEVGLTDEIAAQVVAHLNKKTGQ